MEERDPIPALKQQARDALIAAIGKYPQSVAAAAIGTDQPRMSDLSHDRLERFALEGLIRFLARLDFRVELVIRPPRIVRVFRRAGLVRDGEGGSFSRSE